MSNYIMDLKFDSKTLRIFSLRITCKIQVLDKNERAPLPNRRGAVLHSLSSRFRAV